jgi:hypothetical protein
VLDGRLDVRSLDPPPLWLGIGGASLLGVADRLGAGAKGKKKKVRCRKELQSCDPADKKQRCYSGLNCDVFDEQVGLRCCLELRSHCDTGANHCCGELTCGSAVGLSGPRCCAGGQGLCLEDADCCVGFDCGQGRCHAIPSDRALKTNVGSVDPADMLARVRELPITTWNSTSDDASIRHIGPMAQDFAALFGVGSDDRHIHPLDGQGIALAAIQALASEVDRLREANARLAERIEWMERGEG